MPKIIFSDDEIRHLVLKEVADNQGVPIDKIDPETKLVDMPKWDSLDFLDIGIRVMGRFELTTRTTDFPWDEETNLRNISPNHISDFVINRFRIFARLNEIEIRIKEVFHNYFGVTTDFMTEYTSIQHMPVGVADEENIYLKLQFSIIDLEIVLQRLATMHQVKMPLIDYVVCFRSHKPEDNRSLNLEDNAWIFRHSTIANLSLFVLHQLDQANPKAA